MDENRHTAVKPEEDLDFEEIKMQIQDYKENLVATLQSDHECKSKTPLLTLFYISSKNSSLWTALKHGKSTKLAQQLDRRKKYHAEKRFFGALADPFFSRPKMQIGRKPE